MLLILRISIGMFKLGLRFVGKINTFTQSWTVYTHSNLHIICVRIRYFLDMAYLCQFNSRLTY